MHSKQFILLVIHIVHSFIHSCAQTYVYICSCVRKSFYIAFFTFPAKKASFLRYHTLKNQLFYKSFPQDALQRRNRSNATLNREGASAAQKWFAPPIRKKVAFGSSAAILREWESQIISCSPTITSAGISRWCKSSQETP